jgi:hypothetical protein
MPRSKQSRQEFFDDLTRHCDGSFAILIVGQPGISKTRVLRDWAKTIDQQNHYFVSEDLISRLKARNEKIQIMGRPELLDKFPYIESVFDSSYNSSTLRDDLMKEFQEELEKSAILAFDDLDLIPFSTQVQLFDLLATNESGKSLALSDFSKTTNECSGNTNQNLDDKKDDSKATLPQIIALVNQPLPELYAQPRRYYRLLIERLAQQVFYLPQIRNYTRAEKEAAFRSVWNDLKFVDRNQNPVDFDGSLREEERTQLLDWIDGLQLESNYRDLQVIAIAVYRELTCPNYDPKGFLVETLKEIYETSRLHPPSQE